MLRSFSTGVVNKREALDRFIESKKDELANLHKGKAQETLSQDVFDNINKTVNEANSGVLKNRTRKTFVRVTANAETDAEPHRVVPHLVDKRWYCGDSVRHLLQKLSPSWVDIHGVVLDESRQAPGVHR